MLEMKSTLSGSHLLLQSVELHCQDVELGWGSPEEEKRILRNRNRLLPVVFWRGNWSFAVSVSEGRHSYFAFKSFWSQNVWMLILFSISVIFDFISRNEWSFCSQNTMISKTLKESDILQSLFLLTCSMISPASPLSTFSFSKLSSWWLRGKSQPVNSLVNLWTLWTCA